MAREKQWGACSCSVAAGVLGGERMGTFSASPFSPRPDAELRAADADAELRTAAGPGQGPHPRWAALLPALLGGCGLLCV